MGKSSLWFPFLNGGVLLRRKRNFGQAVPFRTTHLTALWKGRKVNGAEVKGMERAEGLKDHREGERAVRAHRRLLGPTACTCRGRHCCRKTSVHGELSHTSAAVEHWPSGCWQHARSSQSPLWTFKKQCVNGWMNGWRSVLRQALLSSNLM